MQRILDCYQNGKLENYLTILPDRLSQLREIYSTVNEIPLEKTFEKLKDKKGEVEKFIAETAEGHFAQGRNAHSAIRFLALASFARTTPARSPSER